MNRRLNLKLGYLFFICLAVVLVGCDSPETKKRAEADQNEIKLQEAVAAKAMAEASLARAEAEAARSRAELAEMKADRLESEITNSSNTQAENSDNIEQKPDTDTSVPQQVPTGAVVDEYELDAIRASAEEGDATAQFNLGWMYPLPRCVSP